MLVQPDNSMKRSKLEKKMLKLKIDEEGGG